MNVKVADRIKAWVILVTSLIMVYALYVSKDHITHVALLIGLTGYQAYTLFVLINLPALIGKVLQLRYFAASTRKMGRTLMISSGSLSLVCNVLSGVFAGGFGPAAYGAFVVMMFLALENVVTRIKSASSVTRAKNAESAREPRSEKRGTGKTWSPARRAAHEARKASPVSPGRPPVAAMSAQAMDAEFGE